MQEIIDILEKPLVWPKVKAISGGLVSIEPSKNQIIDALKSRMSQAIIRLREAEPTDFIKMIRLNVDNWEESISMADVRVRTIVAWLKESCDIIEQLQAKIDNLVEGQQAKTIAGS